MSASGNFALALKNLETLIAGSAVFQAMTETADADAARQYIYWPGSDPAVAEEREVKRFIFTSTQTFCRRPDVYAQIEMGDGWTAEGEDTGGAGFYHRIPLRMILSLNQDKDQSAEARQVEFLNFAGGVIADMEALAKTEGYLMVTSISMDELTMNDPYEHETYCEAAFTLGVG